MKRIILLLFAILCTCVAHADNNNTVTSKGYVDTQIATLQDKIPAIDSNTVLTHTGAPGEIDSKKIYDTSADYGSQTDALVAAGAFNSAVQNAIETEFICIEWLGEHVPGNCLLWKIHNNPAQNGLPAGYTQLEYIESTGTQYLNLGQPIGSGENITVKFEYTVDTAGVWFGARESNSLSAGFVFDFAVNANSLFIISHNTTQTTYRGYSFNNFTYMTPYILNWYGKPFNTPMLSNNIRAVKYTDIDETNDLITPPYNAFLFAYNRGGTVSGKKPMRIYYFMVEGKMNLVPARRNNDGELGMYDTISGAFFTNAGIGEFVAGPATSYLPQNQ